MRDNLFIQKQQDYLFHIKLALHFSSSKKSTLSTKTYKIETNLIIQSIIKMIENQQKKEELKRAKWNIFKVYGISLFR